MSKVKTETIEVQTRSSARVDSTAASRLTQATLRRIREIQVALARAARVEQSRSQ